MADILEQLAALREHETRVAMATLIAARGGSPRPIGAKMFVGEGGRLLGSVSIGGCVDARVVEHGERLLKENRAQRVTVTVDDAEAVELGLACGAEFDLLIEPISLNGTDAAVEAYLSASRISKSGKAAYVITRIPAGGTPARMVSSEPFTQSVPDVFVERIAPADTLLVIGASDVGAALTRICRGLGMRVVVIDGRDRYATRDRFSTADEIHVGMPSELARPYYKEGTYVVLAGHEYKYDLPVLREALRAPVRYVGMLAGRKRADAMRGLLKDEGVSEDNIARLHAPIGIDIGGREPEEIALSIAAQLIAVREDKPVARRG